MRDILFRGFHPDKNGREEIRFNDETIKGYWVEGSFFYHQNRMPCPIGETEESMNKDMVPLIARDGFADWNMSRPIECIEVILGTVGQFTGALDKNKKRIFEGDCVFGTFYGFPFEEKSEHTISFDKNTCGFQMSYFDTENIVITRTIFDK